MAQRKRLTDPVMSTAILLRHSQQIGDDRLQVGLRIQHQPAALRRTAAWHSRPFARRGCRGSLARCGAFSVFGDAAAQCLHEIDHPVRRGKGLPALWNGAGLLGLQMRQQCLLVAVAEGRRVKLAGLADENMLGEPEHVRSNGEVRKAAKIMLGLAHLIVVAQRGAGKPLVVGLKRDHPLALREHEPPERHHPLAAHGFAHHRKGLLPDRLAGHDIIRAIEEALVDRAVRHKSVDLDGVGALDLDRFELRILNDEVLALGHLVAAAFVLGGGRLAGLFIDELLAQAIAGDLVDLPEGDALGTRAGRMERNRTGDQSQFEIAFPVGTHNQLLWFSVYVCAAICRGKDAVFISEAFIPRAGCEPLAEERVDYRAVYRGFAHNFLAVSPTYGRFLYAIARACKATRIVEFGTSMGISTIYLAAALRDNGGGHLISSELEPAKVARARANLDAAGLG